MEDPRRRIASAKVACSASQESPVTFAGIFNLSRPIKIAIEIDSDCRALDRPVERHFLILSYDVCSLRPVAHDNHEIASVWQDDAISTVNVRASSDLSRTLGTPERQRPILGWFPIESYPAGELNSRLC